MVLTVSFVLSPVTGLFCHRRLAEEIPQDLTPASGRQDHTTSPSAGTITRLASYRVHRIPHPTFVTIAKRPSYRGGTAPTCRDDLPDGHSEIFLQRRLDSKIDDLPDGQIT
jgi:hypothetical protein